MRINKSILAASLVTLGLLGYPALSQAYDGDHPSMDGHQCRHSGDVQGKDGWGRLADRLKLSKEQRQAMNAIEDKYRPEMRDLRQLFSDNHAALVKMDATDAKLQELADAQGKTMADMMVLRKKMRDEMSKVLTEEQRQMVKKMLEHRWHHRHWHDDADHGR